MIALHLVNPFCIFLLGVVFLAGGVRAWRFARTEANPFADVAVAVSRCAIAVGSLFAGAAVPMIFGKSIAVEAPLVLGALALVANWQAWRAWSLFSHRYAAMVRWNAGRLLIDVVVKEAQGYPERIERLQEIVGHLSTEVERLQAEKERGGA